MRAINASIAIDKRLWRQDLRASKAHARMLGATGIIAASDADAIAGGLDMIAAEYAAHGVAEDPALEDIHMHVEHRLGELIGAAAGRLHTARSRNDQVATDFRLWCRDACAELDTALADLQRAVVGRADEHAATVMPGFTHLQVAQPVTLGHHLLAYVEMTARDRSRLADCARRLNECPLGAAALAGTGFAIDRAMVAADLGFDRPMRNSLDAVSDRDFALELLAALAIAGVHLSRLADELILWASQPFGFVILPDAWSTGSSIMPQKRNPDAAELTRGHAGRLIGALTGLLATLKGLPLAYSKDLQDDKATLFEAHDLFRLCLQAMIGMIASVGFVPARMRAVAASGHSTATDLADWLVRARGLPFRDAHHLTGRAVAAADAAGLTLAELDLAALDPALAGAPKVDVDASVASRTSFGGTAPARVREAIAAWREELA